MTRLALLISLVVAGCAVDSTRFVAPTSGGRTVVDPAQVQRDETACGTYADARPSEIRYATYVACLVARGYRTYASLVGQRGATGVTIQAERDKGTPEVFRDMTACASEVGTRVDMPPVSELFTGEAGARATNRFQAPFAQCMGRAGYSTTLQATPSAVASARAPAPMPAPTPTGERALMPAPPPAVAPGPAVPPPGAAMPPAAGTSPAPQTGAPPPQVAAVRPPLAARPAPVKLGLFVDAATSPPVVIVVASGTPAGEAGVRVGDVVLRIDGTSIRSEEDIAAVLATKRPGDVVRMDLQRGPQELTLQATLVAR